MSEPDEPFKFEPIPYFQPDWEAARRECRDADARAALTGLLASSQTQRMLWATHAEDAFDIADAMAAERAKRDAA